MLMALLQVGERKVRSIGDAPKVDPLRSQTEPRFIDIPTILQGCWISAHINAYFGREFETFGKHSALDREIARACVIVAPADPVKGCALLVSGAVWLWAA